MTEIWNTLLVHPTMVLLLAAINVFRDLGIAIVVVTVGIRVVLYPLYVQQIRSQRTMQELAPAMNEIKTKFPKDRQRQSEEQMKLYRERGYNPAMGCLPLVLQMPILFAMYSALQQVGCGLGSPTDCPGLTAEEAAMILPSFLPNPIPTGQTLDSAANWLPWIARGLTHEDPLRILPVLAGLTQLVASVMAMPQKPPPGAANDMQAQMMSSMSYYFPLVTVFIAWSLPSGLAVYWIATTVFQIVQQYFVTGWGRLPRFVPLIARIPSPGEIDLHRRESAALAEARHDMGIPPSGGGGQQAQQGPTRRSEKKVKKKGSRR